MSAPYAVNSNACPDDNHKWFYTCFQNISQFQLDIVGFLAILGEGSVLANAQVATLSKIVWLPRLLPAPQALMRPSRPSVLDAAKGSTTAVFSGNHRAYVNHVGNVLVDAEALPAYSIRCVQIDRKRDKGDIKAKIMGPLWMVAVLGCTMSISLISLSIWQKDGFAMLSAICLSSLSTLIGVGNKWQLDLPKRTQNIDAPAGDVVIRYPKGNFLVVQCHEDVARELYFAPENIEYFISHSWKYRMISLVGTILLMTSVICLSNASTHLQIGFACSYMILNAAYWIVAALPARVHWDMSCFEVTEQCFSEDSKAEAELKSNPNGNAQPDKVGDKARRHHYIVNRNKTFTQALWKVIIATKSIGWVKRSTAAPQTETWDIWLREAMTQAEGASSRMEEIDGRMVKVWEVPDWDPQKALAQVMADHQDAV